MFTRLPIRVRLTIAFAGTMAAVLSAAGTLVYYRQGSALDRAIDQGLVARVQHLTALARSGQQRLGGLGERAALAQIISGRVVLAASPASPRTPVLTTSELARARRVQLRIDRGVPSLQHERWRLLAIPVDVNGRPLVIVAGASLTGRTEALDDLRRELLIGGAIALALASAAGYGLAAAALRPVESMRRRAAEISAARVGQRLPVPNVQDEVSRLGETLNAMLTRLEDALTRERTFVANASHELRTPLALTKTEIEVALAGPQTPEALRAALRSAGEETDRVIQLAEDLLLLARLDQGRLPVTRSKHNAVEMLQHIATRLELRAGQENRRIEISAPRDLIVIADARRVEQALGNLVDNALRYGRGTIRVTAGHVDDSVELHVMDEGDGFPEPLLAHAFERFIRADESRGRGGAGLGLAIVASVAAAHDGSAHAANRSDGGADVWLTLPQTSVDADRPTESRAANGYPSFRPERDAGGS